MPNKWFVLKRNATIHHTVLISGSIVIDLLSTLGIGFKKHICIFKKNETMDWYYQVLGIDSVAKFILKNTLEKNNYNEKIKEKWDKHAKNLEQIFNEIEKTNLKKISTKKLLSLYKNSKKHLKKESALGTLSDFLSSDLIKKELEKKFKKITITKNSLIKNINIATTTIYKSPYSEEQKNLLKIALIYQNKKNIEKELKKHVQKYWYLQNDYEFSKKLNKNYFKKQIKESLKQGLDPKNEIKKMDQKHKELIEGKNELIAKAKEKKEYGLIKILRMIDIHGNLWDLKKMMMQKAFYYLDNLLLEIGKRFNVSLNNLKWLSPSEVDLLASNKLKNDLSQEIIERKNFCILKITPNKISVITKKEAKKIAADIEDVADKKKKIITGKIGNTGKVKGKVKIIMNPRNDSNFQKGEILVTGMTTPDFILLMKKQKPLSLMKAG